MDGFADDSASTFGNNGKKPRTKYRNLVKPGIPDYFARMAANSRKAYWFMAETTTVKRAISNERLIRAGYYDLSEAYERIQSACIGRAVYQRYARCGERTGANHPFLLDVVLAVTIAEAR